MVAPSGYRSWRRQDRMRCCLRWHARWHRRFKIVLLSNEQSKPHEAPVITGASTTTSDVHSTLHRGPAQESLEPTGTNYSRPASSEIDDNSEPADRLTDELLNTAFVRMQATLIASRAGHISSSVNTLLRVSDHLKRCLRRCTSTSGDWRDARR